MATEHLMETKESQGNLLEQTSCKWYLSRAALVKTCQNDDLVLEWLIVKGCAPPPLPPAT